VVEVAATWERCGLEATEGHGEDNQQSA
jgi:hypothetical protein